MIITIDGPVGSGKSSVAKELARILGFYYLNTGLLYRAIAFTLKNRLKKDLEKITPQDLAFLANLQYEYRDGKPHIFYDGSDITDSLYDASIEQLASKISTSPVVREAILEFQRAFARRHDVIADGRDCGSIVFPQADYKFYLTADVTERARRLMADTSRTYASMSLEQVKQAVMERDNRDKMRAVAPLTIPQDAVVIDNSVMNFDQTLEEFLRYIDTEFIR